LNRGRSQGNPEAIPAEFSKTAFGCSLPTFTAAELMASELPPVIWAVPEIVPEGVTILAGKPKIGKGWFVLGLCVATATGGVALGTVRVDRGPCLYLALEDNRRRLQKRLDKLLAGGSAPEGLHIALTLMLTITR
jgi:hypothetical protein